MLVARIYGLMWLFAAAVGAVLYLTDSFNATMVILYNLIVLTLAGAGLIAVFLAVIVESHSPMHKA